MKTQGSAASSVLERFPDHMPIILNLYTENEDFRELCDHFAECLDVLANLKSAEKNEPHRVGEYETLTHELAEEIQKIVTSAA